MNIFIAVDSFKGSIKSKQINKLIKTYLENLGHQAISCDISDGGEGFLDAILAKHNYKRIIVDTTDPLDNTIQASYVLNQQTAYIELSEAAGISLIDKKRLNPSHTTTYGLGKLVLDAIDKKATHIIMGIGGSATHDLGLGMMQALGVKFYAKDVEIKEHINGRLLGDITSYDTQHLDEKIKHVSFEIITDVKNTLLGKHGAAYTYAAQKGATQSMIEMLELFTKKFSKIVQEKSSKSYHLLSGSGAAGGFGFGTCVFLNANIHHGIDYMIDLLDIKKDIINCDIVIVGEGKLDKQTINGKAPYGIGRLAKSMNKRVIGIFGMTDHHVDESFLDEIHTIVPTYANFQDSFDHPEIYILKMLKDIKLKK
jgi:glycerate kinase